MVCLVRGVSGQRGVCLVRMLMSGQSGECQVRGGMVCLVTEGVWPEGMEEESVWSEGYVHLVREAKVVRLPSDQAPTSPLTRHVPLSDQVLTPLPPMTRHLTPPPPEQNENIENITYSHTTYAVDNY